ncbi:MAG: hypothetical protein BJ554DRAFT_5010, partial [Olpidium bornovanus]
LFLLSAAAASSEVPRRAHFVRESYSKGRPRRYRDSEVQRQPGLVHQVGAPRAGNVGGDRRRLRGVHRRLAGERAERRAGEALGRRRRLDGEVPAFHEGNQGALGRKGEEERGRDEVRPVRRARAFLPRNRPGMAGWQGGVGENLLGKAGPDFLFPLDHSHHSQPPTPTHTRTPDLTGNFHVQVDAQRNGALRGFPGTETLGRRAVRLVVLHDVDGPGSVCHNRELSRVRERLHRGAVVRKRHDHRPPLLRRCRRRRRARDRQVPAELAGLRVEPPDGVPEEEAHRVGGRSGRP